jgi:hypothetical protein
MGHSYSCGNNTAIGEITLYVEENAVVRNITLYVEDKGGQKELCPLLQIYSFRYRVIPPLL